MRRANFEMGILLTSALYFGAGCIDIQGISTDNGYLSLAGKSDYIENDVMSVGHRTAMKNHTFTVFGLRAGDVRLRLERPDRNDATIQLSVPGTYTSPKDTPEGFIVLDGKIIQARERQGWNGATYFAADGTISIVDTNNGKSLTKDYLGTVEHDGASLIQGHLLVHDGVAESLLPQTAYQRRAIAVMKDGSIAVIESGDMLDLRDFASALVELGVTDAMNLDMGQWSEGWYREPVTERLRTIGFLTGSTDKQSNWIVFRSR